MIFMTSIAAQQASGFPTYVPPIHPPGRESVISFFAITADNGLSATSNWLNRYYPALCQIVF